VAHSRSEIERYVDGALPPEREPALREHLRGCDECRLYYDSLRRVERALAGDADRPAPSETARIVERLLGASARVPNWEERVLWMRPAPWIAAVAATLLLAAGALLLAQPSPTLPARVTGGIVARGDVALPAGAGVAGEFRVPDGQGATLELTRGGTLEAEAGTIAVLAEDGSGVELRVGRIRCQVTPSSRTFSVRTPTGVVQVLGTTFVVAHDEKRGTGVWVVSGTVAVESPDGSGRVLLRTGERTRVETGRPPQPTAPYAPAELAATGWLDVAVAPWAEVFVDGNRVDTTPLTAPLSLSAGPHVLELRNPGMRTHEERIEIEPGETLRLKVRLDPL
jgi:ferric-dicitrate binding protein FerR (iron transport regulator)